jgi:hypothetical protein
MKNVGPLHKRQSAQKPLRPDQRLDLLPHFAFDFGVLLSLDQGRSQLKSCCHRTPILLSNPIYPFKFYYE